MKGDNLDKTNITLYFLESHLEVLNSDITVGIESSTKYFKSLRKLVEKVFLDKDKQPYVVSAYAIDYNSKELKKKESKDAKTSTLKISQKDRNGDKFESEIKILLNKDTLMPSVKFNPMKKLFGKDVSPPMKLDLSALEGIQMLSEALIKDGKKENEPTFLELQRFGLNLLNKTDKYEMILFYILYIDILNGGNRDLIKDIFNKFDLKKMIKPLNQKSLSVYFEKMEVIYKNQIMIFDIIKTIPNCNFNSYLIKFYTIYINLYSSIESYENCERIMNDLKDNNPFDNLILSKLYLSEYSSFYRNIPTSNNSKNSLIIKYITSSENYNNLQITFSIIKDYINSDFVTLLSIITDNYEKINDICLRRKLPLKINDYIIPRENDDLSKIQYYLDILTQKKLNYKFKCIDIELRTWDIYLSNLEKNKKFWEFFQSNIILGSLNYEEINEDLTYISRYFGRDFIKMLELIVTNYDKLREICMNEQKHIIISNYIEQNKNNDIEKIKENLNFIISQKLKDQYETILFDVNIWNYYIFNQFNMDFLTYLEKKLYEGSINSKDIDDCLQYSSNFRSKNFLSMLQIINFNFNIIQDISKREKVKFSIEKFINQQPIDDDLLKIFDQIKIIIEKEQPYSHPSINFDVKIWTPYTQCQVLSTLRLIRKIISECKKMEPDLNEDTILLTRRIHDIGYLEIKNGTLAGEKLLEFLGDEEIYYRDKTTYDLYQKNVDFQNQLNNHANVINELNKQHANLVNIVNNLQKKVSDLTAQNASAHSRISKLETENSRIRGELSSINKEIGSLKRRSNFG